MMVYFRKRINHEMLVEINERIHEEQVKKKQQKKGKGEGKEETEINKGKLLVDATCVPADIRYPTDLSLLNEAREKTEKIIDVLHKPFIGKERKPRTYRKKARGEYLSVAKKRKAGKKEIRKAIRKQLGFVRRNLHHIQKLSQKTTLAMLEKKQLRDLVVIKELYRQQQHMYERKSHTIEKRIVSISQPHVRPIVRGKAGSPVEFGAKMTISVVDGYVFTERLSWENYNEATDLIDQLESYKKRVGFYPASVHVDKIYRNRKNLKFCKEQGIRISGPPLGRPKNDQGVAKKEQKQRKQDELDRIPVEGKFGNGKRRYGMDRIMAKLPDTSESTIGTIILVMNLEKILRDFLLPKMLWLLRKARPFCGGMDIVQSAVQPVKLAA